MERNRSKKAKAFGASRELNTVKKQIQDEETHKMPIPRVPPSLLMTQKLRTTRRFVSGTATLSNLSFTLQNGHNQFLVVTTVGGAAVSYVDSWRLKAIKVWVLASELLGNTQNVSFTITPVAGDVSSNMYNEPEKAYNVDSQSLSEYSTLGIKCGKRSPLGGWHFTTTVNPAGVLFQYNATSGATSLSGLIIMDLEFEYILNTVGLPLGYTAGTATTTVGTLGSQNISGFSLRGTNNLG